MKNFMKWMIAAGFIASCGFVTGCSKSDEEQAEQTMEEAVDNAQDAAESAADSIKDLGE